MNGTMTIEHTGSEIFISSEQGAKNCWQATKVKIPFTDYSDNLSTGDEMTVIVNGALLCWARITNRRYNPEIDMWELTLTTPHIMLQSGIREHYDVIKDHVTLQTTGMHILM